MTRPAYFLSLYYHQLAAKGTSKCHTHQQHSPERIGCVWKRSRISARLWHASFATAYANPIELCAAVQGGCSRECISSRNGDSCAGRAVQRWPATGSGRRTRRSRR